MKSTHSYDEHIEIIAERDRVESDPLSRPSAGDSSNARHSDRSPF